LLDERNNKHFEKQTKPNDRNDREIYSDPQLVYLWELNHPKDIEENNVGWRDNQQ
jgi:hypothetical protein